MTPQEFSKIWPVLKKQVRSLHLPWLDQMTATERDPFMVLVSCILSLRTKDKVTGEASERLFRLARTPGAMSRLPVKKIEKAIYPAGFYRVKAKRIRDLSREIVQKYMGKVPNTIEELLLLKGVGSSRWTDSPFQSQLLEIRIARSHTGKWNSWPIW